MDGLWVCDKLQKIIRERESQIGSVLLNNQLIDMAQYRTLMGEITAYGIVTQEIIEILQKGTHSDEHGTLVTGAFNEKENQKK
jgi:hypothetical protein